MLIKALQQRADLHLEDPLPRWEAAVDLQRLLPEDPPHLMVEERLYLLVPLPLRLVVQPPVVEAALDPLADLLRPQ